jgi:hypothetical protein
MDRGDGARRINISVNLLVAPHPVGFRSWYDGNISRAFTGESEVSNAGVGGEASGVDARRFRHVS